MVDDAVATRIAGDIDLLLIDEFQDTSPIQLALFLRLATLVPECLLVGDTKQSIYGFRGADPALVETVATSLSGVSGALTETLPDNRRSRPGLVSLVNAVFGQAMPGVGIARDHAVVTAHRNEPGGQPDAISLWRVIGKNKALAAQALAQRVARVLVERNRWPVLPRGETTLRPIQGREIAVLVRSNDNAAIIADALAAAGLKVALSAQAAGAAGASRMCRGDGRAAYSSGFLRHASAGRDRPCA